jgi:adenine phosphoribosyltransferase
MSDQSMSDQSLSDQRLSDQSLPDQSMSNQNNHASTKPVDADGLKKLIREVPDFPKKGILFYDITTLLKDKLGFARLIDALSEHYIGAGKEIDLVLGMEARGFIFGPALAYRLNAGFVPVRKPGKLPAETAKISYELEYGSNALEVHRDAIKKGQRILIVDDLLATGGTAVATADLASGLGAEIAGLAFVVELDFLRGREKLAKYEVFSLLHYDR